MPSWNNLPEQMKICNCDCKFCLLPCPSASVVKNTDISIHTHFVLFEMVSILIFCRLNTAVPTQGLFCLFFCCFAWVDTAAVPSLLNLLSLFCLLSKVNLTQILLCLTHNLDIFIFFFFFDKNQKIYAFSVVSRFPHCINCSIEYRCFITSIVPKLVIPVSWQHYYLHISQV